MSHPRSVPRLRWLPDAGRLACWQKLESIRDRHRADHKPLGAGFGSAEELQR